MYRDVRSRHKYCGTIIFISQRELWTSLCEFENITESWSQCVYLAVDGFSLSSTDRLDGSNMDSYSKDGMIGGRGPE